MLTGPSRSRTASRRSRSIPYIAPRAEDADGGERPHDDEHPDRLFVMRLADHGGRGTALEHRGARQPAGKVEHEAEDRRTARTPSAATIIDGDS